MEKVNNHPSIQCAPPPGCDHSAQFHSALWLHPLVADTCTDAFGSASAPGAILETERQVDRNLLSHTHGPGGEKGETVRRSQTSKRPPSRQGTRPQQRQRHGQHSWGGGGALATVGQVFREGSLYFCRDRMMGSFQQPCPHNPWAKETQSRLCDCGVPDVAPWKQIQLGAMRLQVRSMALG